MPQPTEPYFTRPTTEQPYYDISNEAWRERSFAPYPLSAWAEFTFDGVPIRLGRWCKRWRASSASAASISRWSSLPRSACAWSPKRAFFRSTARRCRCSVTVQAERAAEGTVELKLPEGWRSDPAQQSFHLKSAGDTEPLLFSVTPAGDVAARAYTIKPSRSGGKDYATGWQSIGYPGLRPYNQYRPAELHTRKVDVKLAPGLRIGYVMGTGDTVPEAIEALGVTPHLLPRRSSPPPISRSGT